MNAIRPLLAAAVIAASALLPALPAHAETIYLKNGTQVKGKIAKEDPKSFSVDTPDGRRKVNKAEVETLPAPDPMVALVVGLVPGAGHVYVGDYARGAFFFGMAAVVGGATYAATRQIRPSSPSTAAVAAIIGAEVPGLLGAFEAYNQAAGIGRTTRYRIDYDQ